MTKKIAVIGAGATGMTAVKACLEQGFEPVVYEKTNYTGGLWRYQEHVDENGIASVMRSTIINSSKEMSAFSDFPPPAEFPNYMHNTKMVAYFDMYGNSFNFTKYVHFRHAVMSVVMSGDHEETGRWVVTTRNLDTDQVQSDIFNGVMVCTGHHGTVSMPTFPGQDKFKGTIMHTHSLKHSQGFEDKEVVVVGIGNSAGDAAVEISQVSKQVYLSTRRGTWITHRVGPNGMPSDYYFHRRLLTFIMQLLPYWLVCSIHEKGMNRIVDHDRYQLRPKHRCFSQHVFVNDSLPNRILSGTVKVKSDIDHFTEDGVVFKGESEVTKCDAVIMATGYKVSFPFISETILPVVQNRVRLYKHEFIPHLKHAHTLAFISLIQPIGAILPIGELQSRWFALLMANKLKLPSREVMERDIERRDQAVSERYYESERHTIQVDWVPFMDELAKEVGAYPPIWRYLFTDPKLFFALIFGPSAPYQYRLVGPNAWKGAREAQLTVTDRVNGALNTNRQQPVPSSDSTQQHSLILKIFLGILAFFGFFFRIFF